MSDQLGNSVDVVSRVRLDLIGSERIFFVWDLHTSEVGRLRNCREF
jgi:hypothetical protein